MHKVFRDAIWNQFGAAIDMLENAINACPDSLWQNSSQSTQFWYRAYHPLFWLDCYLSDSDKDFLPPSPFTLSEFDPEGILPESVYSKNELLIYLNYGREKLKKVVSNLDEKSVDKLVKFENIQLKRGEFLLYNMRHLQHHTAQLNMILRQEIDSAPGWVRQTKILKY